MVIISGKLIWILELNKALNRKTAEITFDPHLFEREEQRNLDVEKILESVRTGRFHFVKCKYPNKICYKRYFGKENRTYVVIVRYFKSFIEVKTAWQIKGK